MFGTKNNKLNRNYYLKLAQKICSSLKLNNNSTMFIFGSVVNNLMIYEKNKIKQTRYFDCKEDLVLVKFEKAKIYPDLDLRIITTECPDDIRNRAKFIIEHIRSKVLIELKVDDYVYPFNDINNGKITSFFRRVFVLGNVMCLHNSKMLRGIIKLSKRHITKADYIYDKQRKEVILTVKNKLIKSRSFTLDGNDLLKFPVYFNKRIIINERLLRNNSILIKNNIGENIWNEKVI